MLFPTLEFAIFFFVVFWASWAMRHQAAMRKWFLVLASYFFYGYWDVRFCLLLLNCSVGNYLVGLGLARYRSRRARKCLVAVAIIFNLGILGFFKYYGFFMANLANLLSSLGFARDIPILEVVLPVGISFFTFQGISYVVDVYRREIEPSTSLVDVLLYISFFPQLVAGPIVRAARFFPQLQGPVPAHHLAAGYALILIMGGLFKKVIIAHYLAQELVAPVFEDPASFSSIDVLFGVYGYAVQIYCDFSAYTDIAIGVAALLGFRFARNFNQPYRAQSLRDFWRRWHISLSSWLRDYLYIPLGGSRYGRAKTYRNLLLTMLLGGLWHGAAWNFVMWGALHGGYLALERYVGETVGKFARGPCTRGVATLAVFHFVCFTWIFFASDSLAGALEYLQAFGNTHLPITQLTGLTFFLIVGSMCSHFVPEESALRWEGVIGRLPVPLQGALAGALTVAIAAAGPEGIAPFIYFRF